MSHSSLALYIVTALGTMIVELLVTTICLALCCTNVYVIAIFVVHRNQLTPRTLLQANLAFCNLLASYYLATATFEEAIFGTGSYCTDNSLERTTGWNMTLSSLSASSWAFTIILWFHANQRKLESVRRDVTVNVSYGFVGATWLYFILLVLAHMLRIYGWTFDSHDSSELSGWAIFVMLPFLLPWLLQAWIFVDINAAGFLDNLNPWSFCKKSGGEKVLVDGGVESKDEMVIIENEEEKGDKDATPQDVGVSQSDSMEFHLSLASNLFICGIISVLLALLGTRLISDTTTEDLLPKLFIALVCATWINCSVSPFILFSCEREVESSRKYVDDVIRAVVKSLGSYLMLYVPARSGWVNSVIVKCSTDKQMGEKKDVDESTESDDQKQADVC